MKDTMDPSKVTAKKKLLKFMVQNKLKNGDNHMITHHHLLPMITQIIQDSTTYIRV